MLKRIKQLGMITPLITTSLLSGCGVSALYSTGFNALGPGMLQPKYVDRYNFEITDDWLVETDAPVQVVYRIDKNRFVTFENYLTCDHGGVLYYNDIAQNIKTQLNYNANRETLEDFGYHHDFDYTGTFYNSGEGDWLAFPFKETSTEGGFYYSVDGGRTFAIKRLSYMGDKNPVLWVGNNVVYGTMALRIKNVQLLNYNPQDGFEETIFNPEYYETAIKIKTPSGDNQYTCDTSLQATLSTVKDPNSEKRYLLKNAYNQNVGKK